MFCNARTAALIGALSAFAWIGCGEDSSAPAVSGGAPEEVTTAESAGTEAELAAAKVRKHRRKTTIRLEDSEYGPVLFDGKGRVLYLFTADGRRSHCHGACADAWPPFIVRGRLRARGGADNDRLGIAKRRNGARQATYAGHPLYYYVHDGRHQILCHGVAEFGGDWLVVQANGKPAP